MKRLLVSGVVLGARLGTLTNSLLALCFFAVAGSSVWWPDRKHRPGAKIDSCRATPLPPLGAGARRETATSYFEPTPIRRPL